MYYFLLEWQGFVFLSATVLSI